MNGKDERVWYWGEGLYARCCLLTCLVILVSLLLPIKFGCRLCPSIQASSSTHDNSTDCVHEKQDLEERNCTCSKPCCFGVRGKELGEDAVVENFIGVFSMCSILLILLSLYDPVFGCLFLWQPIFMAVAIVLELAIDLALSTKECRTWKWSWAARDFCMTFPSLC